MSNNQKGQALIELIIFLPLMLMFYTMIAGFANAINGSINQQKITRAYFYYRLQGNSTIPKPSRIEGSGSYAHQNWSTFGMFFVGWKDYFESLKPVAPCYKLTIPLNGEQSDTCQTKYTEPSTQFIRVQTVYGMCGATYQRIGGDVLFIPDFRGGDFSYLISKDGCLLTQ